MSSPGRSSRGEQVYRLKSVRYQNSARKILLQNENGPCPLLAASNALLLRGVITLPPSCIRNGMASLYDVVNMLGMKAMNHPRLQAEESQNRAAATAAAAVPPSPSEVRPTRDAIEATTIVESVQTQTRQQKLQQQEQTQQSVTSEPAPAPELAEETDPISAKKQPPRQPQQEPPSKLEDATASNNNSAACCAEQFIFSEVLDIIPTLQDGMDVNPRFTSDVTGYEYTKQLNAFDLLNVELVHGWLIDPEQEKALYDIVGNRTYNESIELVIQGQEAKQEVDLVNKNMQQALLTLSASPSSSSSDERKGSKNIQNNSSENKPAAAEEKEENTKNKDREEWIEVAAVDTPSDEPATNIQSTIITETNNTTNLDSSTVTEQEPPNEKGTSDDENVTATTTTGSSSTKSTRMETEAELQTLTEKKQKLDQDVTSGSLINNFLNTSSHQLTHYGLTKLYEHINANELCVFFRNNHFATITKNETDGLLYLLVTDLGYANVATVVWEKFDVINGDTEYVDANFVTSPALEKITSTTGATLTPEQLLAQSSRQEADYQLALRMSMGDTVHDINHQENELMEAATEASLREYNGISTPPADPNIQHNNVAAPATIVATIPDKNSTLASMPAATSARNEAGGHTMVTPGSMHAQRYQHNQEESDRILALQLRDAQHNEDASLALARKLQAEENNVIQQQQRQQQRQQQQVATANDNSNSNCTIS